MGWSVRGGCFSKKQRVSAVDATSRPSENYSERSPFVLTGLRIMTLKEIRANALKLDDDDRELLAVQLFESLAPADSQSEIDEEWKAEILSRSERHRLDDAKMIDANESLQRIRDRLHRENSQ